MRIFGTDGVRGLANFQLTAELALGLGARVIGTASERNHHYLRGLGAEPITYGEGLADRVRELATHHLSTSRQQHDKHRERLAHEGKTAETEDAKAES